MKKSFLLIISFIFISCNDINVQDSTNYEIPKNNQRIEQLNLMIQNNDYISSTDEMISALKAVCLFDNKNNNRSSIIYEPTFELLNTEQINCPTLQVDSVGRAIESEIFDTVTLYLYNIKNNSSNGFAITSCDKRFGNVLAYIPAGNFNDANENEFMNYYLDMLHEYINDTSRTWSILKANKNKSISRSSNGKILEINQLSNKKWIYNYGNTNHILKTQWGQGYPYNAIVYEAKKEYYPVGCGPVALAMLLADRECLEKCSVKGYENIVYDWKKMKQYSNISYLDYDAQRMVQALLYECGLFLNANYGLNGTSCKNGNFTNFFYNNKCYYEGFYNYSFSNVKNYIDNAYPIICCGFESKETSKKKIFGITVYTKISYKDGHYWIIDGYANLRCIDNNNDFDYTANYVHCNLGWNSSCDGYYLDGVFDTSNLLNVKINEISSRNSSSGFYAYKNEILSHFDYGVIEIDDDDDE